MAQFVDGKKIADEILEDLRLKIKDLRTQLRLVVVLVGNNPASESYVKIKQKKGEQIGINVEVNRYPAEITEQKLKAEIQKFNSEPTVGGIIVQLPLPVNLNRDEILNSVDPKLDVDCLTSENKQRLIRGEPYFLPPAAAAAVRILEYYNVALPGKNILIVGSGDLIGKPVSAMLLNKKVPFELANRHTENLNELAARADVIITGVGKAGLITGDMIKDGAVIIDAGTTGSDEGEIIGDVDQASVMGKASLLAPVPGGVGPVTVAILFENLVKSAKK